VSRAEWPRNRPRKGIVAAVNVMVALALAGCSSVASTGASVRSAHTAASALPATTPYLLMSNASTGWAIWPSGNSWLLLGTDDGWRTVSNVTPIAVPTGGGLVVASAGDKLAAAVGAFERLVSSPVLTKKDTTAQWSPAELPGAVVDDRNAISLRAGRTAAIVKASGGTVVIDEDGSWLTLTTAANLFPNGALHLNTITWADRSVGWLTGYGPVGTTVAFQTTNAGKSWSPVPVSGPSTVAAMAPCGAGRNWLLPVIGGDKITLQRTSDAGLRWYPGASIPLATGTPAWGCRGHHVWMVGSSGAADHIFASDDGGRSWEDRGTAPPGLSALSPETGSSGFAVSRTATKSTLWAVTDNGAQFSARSLPGWVATLGGQEATS
jgi:hypothetical protein